MSWIRRLFSRVNKDRRGLEALEYLLIAALVIIATIGAWKVLGQSVKKEVSNITTDTNKAVDDARDSGKSDK
jgi:Flp pilus assembly pilin Flp